VATDVNFFLFFKNSKIAYSLSANILYYWTRPVLKPALKTYELNQQPQFVIHMYQGYCNVFSSASHTYKIIRVCRLHELFISNNFEV